MSTESCQSYLPGESQSAYGCCCLMASGASKCVVERQGGKQYREFDRKWRG